MPVTVPMVDRQPTAYLEEITTLTQRVTTLEDERATLLRRIDLSEEARMAAGVRPEPGSRGRSLCRQSERLPWRQVVRLQAGAGQPAAAPPRIPHSCSPHPGRHRSPRRPSPRRLVVQRVSAARQRPHPPRCAGPESRAARALVAADRRSDRAGRFRPSPLRHADELTEGLGRRRTRGDLAQQHLAVAEQLLVRQLRRGRRWPTTQPGEYQLAGSRTRSFRSG